METVNTTSPPPPPALYRRYLTIQNQLGADFIVNVKGLPAAVAAANIVGEGGRRPDACVDCCGFESSVATALAATKSGGKVCLVGMVRELYNQPRVCLLVGADNALCAPNTEMQR